LGRRALIEAVSTIVRTCKAAVTRAIGRLLEAPRSTWQRNYYEHVIRDEADCPCASRRKDVRWPAVPPMAKQTPMSLRSVLHEDRIRRCIEANPMNSEEDEENPDSLSPQPPSRSRP
jgi:hypothetical protein